MQMRRHYYSRNRYIRADEKTRDANECLEAGFTEFAHINAQTAAMERGEDWQEVQKL
jgi:hypothetical protein